MTLDTIAARLEGLLKRASLARMALTAMQCDNPMKSYPTSHVYPQAVRNAADTMQDAIDALLSERRALREECERLRGQSDVISDKSRIERLRRLVHRWITQGQVLGIVHDMDIQCEIDDAMAWVNENPEANGGEHD